MQKHIKKPKLSLNCLCQKWGQVQHGIDDSEEREGRKLAEIRRQERLDLRSYLGDPSYGGWTEVSHRKNASTLLIDETNALVDAYAQILDRTLTTYQGRIKPEEARSLLVTAYIQRSKLSFAA